MVGKGVAVIAAMFAVAASAPAFARVADFVLVNGTMSTMESIAIRRFRSGAWQPLAGAQGPGDRIAVQFKDEDCAFDIRATFASNADVLWSGVNLCEARAVILKRDETGLVWVDYD